VITLDDSDSELDDFERSFQALGRKKGKLRRSQTTTQTTQRVMLRDDDGSEELLTYKRVEETASTRSRRRPHRQPETKKYVYADLCAGAGGTSGGAKAAGLKLKYLLDLEPDACKSLMLNFGGAATLKMDISAFATSSTVGGIVDVMHISFPCQGHSMLNRQQNPEQDARNISTAYGSLSLILQKCKPRIVTLEQVAGIMYRSDGQHLRGQIYEMVEAGYSVRWSLLNFADYGLVQPRPRVIVIASCAGQTLPPFPKPTHGNGPGLKRPTTIADILSQVPPQIPGIMGHAFTRNYKSYDPSVPLRGCITSGGVAKKSGNGYHPSGRRDFNLQEMAQMQGFRAEHRFYGGVTSIRKQIGNAYPSLVAEVVFRGVIKALEERDQKIEEWGKTIEL
jgi:DNA (cytosine-5)-methyltransferase 1